MFHLYIICMVIILMIISHCSVYSMSIMMSFLHTTSIWIQRWVLTHSLIVCTNLLMSWHEDYDILHMWPCMNFLHSRPFICIWHSAINLCILITNTNTLLYIFSFIIPRILFKHYNYNSNNDVIYKQIE